ncbi:MAG: FecR domain-containing protein [Nitrospirae bacterium]|nr:FecR domain-containing protein [Nitrospirota bacterium]
MKSLRSLMLLLMMVFVPSMVFAAGLGELRVSLLEGDVQFWNEDTGEWVAASINMPLREGDRLWAPEGGRLELMLRDGTCLRLDENSALEILTLDRDSSQFYLTEGYAYVNFRPGRGGVFQLDTPAASIRAYEKAVFKAEVERDGDAEVSVFKGALYAESRSGNTKVSAGRALHIKSREEYADLAPLGGVDNWERWNKDRDGRVYNSRYSLKYLPEELESYAYDFDENGKWVYTNEYGYVWTPTAGISAGWAPYRLGRWTWIMGDYVWVGYEPWGWAPYHYGRWISHNQYGWCWVPPAKGSAFWGPGYVGWVNTSSAVAWVPLAPDEIYYGYGNYGPNSVNISVGIDLGRRPRYRNAFVNNGVTTLHIDTFLRGRHVDHDFRDNPFSSDNFVFGRPKRLPEKIISRPVIKEIPLFRRPPKTLNDYRIHELKASRPLVREKNRSIFTPRAAPKNMPLRNLREKKARDPRTPFGGAQPERDRHAPDIRRPQTQPKSAAEINEEDRRRNPMKNAWQSFDWSRRQNRVPE